MWGLTCILPSLRAGPSSANRRMNRPMLYSFPPLRLKPKPRWLRSSSTTKQPCTSQTHRTWALFFRLTVVKVCQISHNHCCLKWQLFTHSHSELGWVNHVTLERRIMQMDVNLTGLEPGMMSVPISFGKREFFISVSPFLLKKKQKPHITRHVFSQRATFVD